MKKLIFWVVLTIVCVPVILGIMSNELTPAICALAWGAIWWAIFTSTKIGRRMFLKGYRIAATIMQDC